MPDSTSPPRSLMGVLNSICPKLNSPSLHAPPQTCCSSSFSVRASLSPSFPSQKRGHRSHLLFLNPPYIPASTKFVPFHPNCFSSAQAETISCLNFFHCSAILTGQSLYKCKSDHVSLLLKTMQGGAFCLGTEVIRKIPGMGQSSETNSEM